MEPEARSPFSRDLLDDLPTDLESRRRQVDLLAFRSGMWLRFSVPSKSGDNLCAQRAVE